MKSCCITPTCCSLQRTRDDSSLSKTTLEIKPPDIPMAEFPSTDTLTQVTPVVIRAAHACVTPCAICRRRLMESRTNKSPEHSDSSLDIDLDDPHLIQALDDCIQRGGGGVVGSPRGDINKVNTDNSKAQVISTAERVKNVDFIETFFQNNNPAPDDFLRRNAFFAPLLHSFVPPPIRSHEENIKEWALHNSIVIPRPSSSSPSCYQTGTNNSVPGVPANSPNDTSASNSRFGVNVKHLQGFRRRSSRLRRQYSTQSQSRKYVANAIRLRQKIWKNALHRQQRFVRQQRCMQRRTDAARLSSRPPRQGQEVRVPVQRVICNGYRRFVGGDENLTPLQRRRLRTGCGRNRTPVMYCRTPPKAGTAGARDARNNEHRCVGVPTLIKSPVKKSRVYMPSEGYANSTNTQKETEDSESDGSSRENTNFCPWQLTVESRYDKVTSWLSTQDAEDTYFNPYALEDISMDVEQVKRCLQNQESARDSSSESARSFRANRSIVSTTVNQFLHPVRPRRGPIMVANKGLEDRFPMPGCKRLLLSRHHCDIVHRLKWPRGAESRESFSDNDDERSSCGSRCERLYGGYGERARFESQTNSKTPSWIADDLEACATKRSLSGSESESSADNFRMAAPPPSESSRIVSNRRNNVYQNLNPPSSFDCLRGPISAMSTQNERRQNCLLRERPISQYRVVPLAMGSPPDQPRIPAPRYLGTTNLVYRPQFPRAVCLADRRRQMAIRSFKSRQQTEQNDPLETLAIL